MVGCAVVVVIVVVVVVAIAAVLSHSGSNFSRNK